MRFRAPGWALAASGFALLSGVLEFLRLFPEWFFLNPLSAHADLQLIQLSHWCTALWVLCAVVFFALNRRTMPKVHRALRLTTDLSLAGIGCVGITISVWAIVLVRKNWKMNLEALGPAELLASYGPVLILGVAGLLSLVAVIGTVFHRRRENSSRSSG